MAIEEERRLNWFTIVAVLLGLIGILGLCPAVVFFAFYDQPLVPEAGMGVMDFLFIFSVVSFPFVCIGSSLGILLVKDRKRLAFFLFPVLSLILIYVMFNWVKSL